MSPALSGFRKYWESSKAPRYSLLFVVPLVVAYEALAALLSYQSGSIRNGADAILRGALTSLAGPYGPPVFGVLLIAVCLYLLQRDLKSSGGDLRLAVFFGMVGESALLAAVFGVVVAMITVQLLVPFVPLAIAQHNSLGPLERIMVSLGAGVYEELLFRVFLVSALTWLLRTVAGWGTTASALAAVFVSATIFSAFHYVGPLGDEFQIQSFTFRLIAGVFFSGLYVLRGFGITAWTHALYDLYLLF